MQCLAVVPCVRPSAKECGCHPDIYDLADSQWYPEKGLALHAENTSTIGGLPFFSLAAYTTRDV